MSFSSEANLEYIAVEEYEKALKAGKKYVHQCLRKGEYPYTYVLDEILDESDSFDRQDVGLVDIPADFIVGTQSAGRMAAFAGNYHIYSRLVLGNFLLTDKNKLAIFQEMWYHIIVLFYKQAT